jgi:hypothetical protein
MRPDGGAWGWVAWDARAALRAGIAASGLVGVAVLVTAATDEGGVAWGARVARTLPVVPACGAIATWLVLGTARGRGEVRALEALGRAPWQNARGAVLGAALVAAIVAGAIGATRLDVRGFFPEAPRAAAMRFDGAAFHDPTERWIVPLDGIPRIETGASSPAAPSPERPLSVPARTRATWADAERPVAALVTLIAGLALPLAAARGSLGRRRRGRLLSAAWVRAIAATAATGLAEILFLHLAAAHRGPAWLALLPPAALLGALVLRYTRDVAVPLHVRRSPRAP